ncbi:FAD-dependent monooxygenase [Kribbella sp. NPDC051770]|uniref:NAD(P)/FAD-dependent oxidoreductase n=1 Tax=Kribbella sp. NPDC051770 TaxID=3155413 RepID=UPI00343813E3
MILRRAVVLGASMAGLMAARVLSDHADEVLVIERDDSDNGDDPRPGVPQGTQVHALLPAGAAQLDRWFPGFSADAVAEGLIEPTPDQAYTFVNGVRRVTPPPLTEIRTLISTRPFLESRVRQRTLALPNVRLVAGRADGIGFTGDRVTSVQYVAAGSTESVDADLVVDATGRSSRLSDWLGAAGWPEPTLTRMPIKLNYASALFERKPGEVLLSTSQTMAQPGQTARMGGILPVEGDRWLVLVAGFADDRPSRETEDFHRRCREDFPWVYAHIVDNNPMIGDVVTYHQADSRRRNYDELDRFPAGLIVAGDAVASFNPIYGQGMTSATLHASCLSAYLRSNPALDEPAWEYLKQVRVVVDAAWQISTFADLALPHVNGPFPRGYKLTRWFTGLILSASLRDAQLNDDFARVTTMLAHPNLLAQPKTLARALRGAIPRPLVTTDR